MMIMMTIGEIQDQGKSGTRIKKNTKIEVKGEKRKITKNTKKRNHYHVNSE